MHRNSDFRGAWLAVLALLLVLASTGQSRAADPLPSWNEGAAKAAIITFVERVTTENTPDFVPARRADRGVRQ